MTEQTTTPVVAYVLRLGDDALILAQRTGEWIAAAPQLEEDVALGNIALDLLGQARALLTYAGELVYAMMFWESKRVVSMTSAVS